MTEFENLDQEEKGKRPVSLLVLCILTFVYTGFSLLVSIWKFIAGPFSDAEMKAELVKQQEQTNRLDEAGMSYWVEVSESVMKMTKQINDNHYLATSVMVIVALVGLFAAIKMFKGDKLGFHLYIIYCILGIVSIYTYVAMVDVHPLNVIVGVIVSFIFILLYSRNLKWMR